MRKKSHEQYCDPGQLNDTPYGNLDLCIAVNRITGFSTCFKANMTLIRYSYQLSQHAEN